MLSESITFLIMRHLSLIDKVNQLSYRILYFAKSEDIQNLERESENRERLVNLIGETQEKIEEKINDFVNPSEADTQIIRAWVKDIHNWVSFTNLIDQETANFLVNQRKKIQEEISNLHKAKESFKGYNLNSVKK